MLPMWNEYDEELLRQVIKDNPTLTRTAQIERFNQVADVKRPEGSVYNKLKCLGLTGTLSL